MIVIYLFMNLGQFQMLPTDRWPWSSKDGKQSFPKDSFQLPSVEWIWEGDWYIDRGLDGDKEVIK